MIRPPRRHRTKDAYQNIPNPIRRLSLRILDSLDLLVYVLVGLAFIVAACMALSFSLLNLASHFGLSIVSTNFGQNVLDFVSDLLLVLIIMEVLGTVRSYLEKGDTSVKPFMFIGIISATRGILSIGARLSIQGNSLMPDEFRDDMIELGVNAIIIIALGSTLKIMGDSAEVHPDDSSDGPTTNDIIERVTVETTIPGHQHHNQPDTLTRPQDG